MATFWAAAHRAPLVQDKSGPCSTSSVLPCCAAGHIDAGLPLRQAASRRQAAQQQQQQRGWLGVCNSLSQKHVLDPVAPPTKLAERDVLRMGVPSKGRMAEDTLQLLRDCQLSVYKPNPRQYAATIQQLPGVEIWFQRASDVVRKLVYGDIDLGIVGFDMFCEIAGDSEELVVVHDALGFGQCYLALGVPMSGKFVGVDSLDALRDMPDWTAERPLRVVTGYHGVARRFFEQNDFKHVALLSADGALEAAPAMGSADIILDLVSTGVTLRENNLKMIEGGRILDSQGVLVANKRALMERRGLLEVVHELIERLDAHLKAEQYYSVIANMRGDSAEEVAARLLASPELRGLQGPTVSPVFTANAGGGGVSAEHGFWATVICVNKKCLYPSVKELRKLGGSGVLVQPMTYIFDEEPLRWKQLVAELGIEDTMAANGTSAGNGSSA